MVELVYAHASGACESNLVRVRVPPCPPNSVRQRSQSGSRSMNLVGCRTAWTSAEPTKPNLIFKIFKNKKAFSLVEGFFISSRLTYKLNYLWSVGLASAGAVGVVGFVCSSIIFLSPIPTI